MHYGFLQMKITVLVPRLEAGDRNMEKQVHLDFCTNDL
jgi:hypothetical protein